MDWYRKEMGQEKRRKEELGQDKNGGREEAKAWEKNYIPPPSPTPALGGPPPLGEVTPYPSTSRDDPARGYFPNIIAFVHVTVTALPPKNWSFTLLCKTVHIHDPQAPIMDAVRNHQTD